MPDGAETPHSLNSYQVEEGPKKGNQTNLKNWFVHELFFENIRAKKFHHEVIGSWYR